MSVFIALLRAVNVGGTGKLAMRDLVALCHEAGFSDARTYIQSGNVVFSSDRSAAQIKATLERAVSQIVGKPTGVLVRTRDELARVLAENPFPGAPPNRVIVYFLDEAPAQTVLTTAKGVTSEQLVLRGRELYIHYPESQASSRLRLPLFDQGTGRNLNTVAKLVAMAQEQTA